MSYSNKFKEQFLKDNDKLIRKIAYRYCNDMSYFDDILQETKIATLKYLDRYNSKRNIRPQTYVFTCVDRKMRTIVKDMNRLIRIPLYLTNVHNHIKKLEKEYNIEINNLDDALKYTNYDKFSLTSYFKFKDKAFKSSILTIDNITNDNGTELDFIETNNTLSYEVDYDKNLNCTIDDILHAIDLKNRTRDIIKLRFEKNMKYTEIAKIYNKSFQNMQTTVDNAIKKFRKNKEFVKNYKELIND